MLKNNLPIVLTAITLFLAPKLHDHSFSYLYFIGTLSLLLSVTLFKLLSAYNTVITVPTNNYVLFFTGFTAWSFLSISWSPVPSDSFYSAVIFLVLPLSLLLAFWSTVKQQHTFYLALAAFILITLAKTYYQRFILVPQLPAPGFFSNKNTNATFIAMILLPFCTYFLTEKQARYKRHFTGLIIACGSFIITLTVSRGALLGLCIGLFLILLHTLFEKQSIKTYLILLGYLALGFLIAELLTGSSYSTRLINQSVSSNMTTISTGRDYIWNSGLQMYLEQPILGRGLNMFHWLFPQFRHIDAPDIGQFAHNDYLQFLIELGPIGFTLMIGFVITFLKSSWMLYLKTADKDQKLFYLGLIAACIAVLTHSLFTFNLYQPAPLLLLGLYIGVLTQGLDKQKLQKTLSVTPSKIKRLTKTGYIGIITSIALVFVYFVAINSLTLFKVYQTYPNNLVALDNTIQATTLTPYKEEYVATQANLYRQLLSMDAHMFSEQGKQQLFEQGIEASDLAIKQNPFRDLNYTNKAHLYLLHATADLNHFDEIVNAYSEAVRLNPFNLETRLHFADALMKFNEKEMAFNVLNGGLGRTYVSKYQNGILYLQILLALVITSNDQPAIERIKHQINVLLDKKEQGGYFTLQ